MIRPLRVRHRRTWLLLAVAVPLLVALALLARPDRPHAGELPAPLGAAAASVESGRR